METARSFFDWSRLFFTKSHFEDFFFDMSSIKVELNIDPGAELKVNVVFLHTELHADGKATTLENEASKSGGKPLVQRSTTLPTSSEKPTFDRAQTWTRNFDAKEADESEMYVDVLADTPHQL